MPSPDVMPPTAESYLWRVLRQGSIPFRYRSGVRSLLGMPASGEDAIVGAASMPPIEFRYALPQSFAPMAATELLTAEQWLEAALDDPDSDKGRNPLTPRADTVGAAPPPRSGQGPPTLAPRTAFPQVTPVDVVPLPTLVSQTGVPPSEASLGGLAGDPGSAARTHVSSVLQSAGFTAVPTRMDNCKVGPSVTPNPMPLVDAPPRVSVTASAYQPTSSAVEQIARLRRTIAELAAQVAAQRDFQQRPTPLFPPPVRPVGRTSNAPYREQGRPAPSGKEAI